MAAEPSQTTRAEGGGAVHAPDAARRAEAFRRARRHSRIVRLLRVVLPTASGATLVAFAVAAKVAMPPGLDISVGRTSVSSTGIVMDQPRISGFDEEKREYRIIAARATQEFAAPDRIALETIEAEVLTPDHGRIRVEAGDGDYDHKAKALALAGGVRVRSEDGYAMEMEDVQVAFGPKTLRSDKPVRIVYKGGDTVGSRIEATDGGKLVVLEGKVRTTISPSEMKRPAGPAVSDARGEAPASAAPQPASLTIETSPR